MAAPMANYSGGTFLTDLVTRPEFLQYIQEAIYNQCKWIQSGAVVRDNALDAKRGGVSVQVPFFRPINPTEERIQSNATWGTSGEGYLTPQAITGDEQIMPILHRGFAYACDDLSRLGTGADPMAAIRNQLAAAINVLRSTTLVDMFAGMFDTALADNVWDVSTAVAGATAANYLTAAAVVGAKHRLGERSDELKIIAMHSDVYAYLQQVGALTFSSNSLASGAAIEWGGGGIGVRSDDIAWFMGLRVIVDDMITPTLNAGGSDQYPVYLTSNGCIAEGVQQELRIEAERNILSKQDVLSTDYHYGFHVFGTNFSGPANPTNANLATAANWEMVYNTSRMVYTTCLVVNTPFATNT